MRCASSLLTRMQPGRADYWVQFLVEKQFHWTVMSSKQLQHICIWDKSLFPGVRGGIWRLVLPEATFHAIQVSSSIFWDNIVSSFQYFSPSGNNQNRWGTGFSKMINWICNIFFIPILNAFWLWRFDISALWELHRKTTI